MVREALRVASPSLVDIAKRVGVSKATVHAYSAGNRTPGRKILRALAQAFRQQAYELMGWADQLDSESNR